MTNVHEYESRPDLIPENAEEYRFVCLIRRARKIAPRRTTPVKRWVGLPWTEGILTPNEILEVVTHLLHVGFFLNSVSSWDGICLVWSEHFSSCFAPHALGESDSECRS